MHLKLLHYLFKKYAWIYERESGDRGIVFARSYRDALRKLRKIYPDTYQRMDSNGEMWMEVFDINHVDRKDDVYITEPW